MVDWPLDLMAKEASVELPLDDLDKLPVSWLSISLMVLPKEATVELPLDDPDKAPFPTFSILILCR